MKYNLIDNIIDKNFEGLSKDDFATIAKYSKLFCKPENIPLFKRDVDTFVGSLFDPYYTFKDLVDKYFEITIFERNINKLIFEESNIESPKSMLLKQLKDCSVEELFAIIEYLRLVKWVFNTRCFCELVNEKVSHAICMNITFNIFGATGANRYLYDNLDIDYSKVEIDALLNIIIDNLKEGAYPLAKAIEAFKGHISDDPQNRTKFAGKVTKEAGKYKKRLSAMN